MITGRITFKPAFKQLHQICWVANEQTSLLTTGTESGEWRIPLLYYLFSDVTKHTVTNSWFIILSYQTCMYLIEICWISLGNLIKNLNKYFCWMNVKNKPIVLHSYSDARQRVPRRWRWWRRGWWVRTEGRYVSIPPTQHVPPTLASCRWLCGAGDLRTAAHWAHWLQQDIYASCPGMC